MDTEEEKTKKRKIDAEQSESENIHEKQHRKVDAIASNIKWNIQYDAATKEMSIMDAKPGSIFEMMRIYIGDNADKEEEVKKVKDMITGLLDQPKK